jgi:signal transduction histidine kinase
LIAAVKKKMRYNDRMTLDHSLPARNDRLLNLAVYLSLALLVSVGFVLSPDWFVRSAITVLCLAFAVVHQFGFSSVQNVYQAHLYLAVQLVIVAALCLVAGSGDPFNFPFFILGVQAMLVLRPRIATVWIALFYIVGCLAVALRDGSVSPVYLLFYLSAYIFVAVFGYTLRQVEFARRHNEELLAELSIAQQQLQALAVAEERNRLARELHDSTKQQAFALSGQLGAARALIGRDPQAAERHLHQAEQLADTLRQELAALILDLRPPALEQQDLVAALRQYLCDWSQQQSSTATILVDGPPRPLPPAVESTIFRIAQEALANTSRHSQAQNVELRLSYEPEQLTLTVIDDGCGFDLQQTGSGVGLHSMRERVAALPRGALTLDSAPGAGTRICVHCRA